MRLLTVLLLLTSFMYAEEVVVPTADIYLTQAKELLAKGKPALSGAEAERIDRALAALEVLTAKQPEIVEKLDAKLLKSVINAKFLAKGAAGDDLTVSYTTWDGSTLSDWTVTGNAPTLIKGSLALEPGALFTNKIQFKSTVTVQGEVMCANKEGKHFGSTGGFFALVDSYNAWLIHLQVNGANAGTATFDKAYTQTDGGGTWIPFSFKLEKGAASLTWKGQKLAGQMNGDFGALVLTGGTGGNQFRGITISGTVDREWVKAAVQQKALDEAVSKKKK